MVLGGYERERERDGVYVWYGPCFVCTRVFEIDFYFYKIKIYKKL